MAIQSLKDSKAPGIDSVLWAEAIKYGGQRLLDKLVALLNFVKNDLVIPNEWKTFICVCLAKNGDPTKMSNYRGITLMSITSKVYYRLLLNHIWDPLEKILCVNQGGFCRDCGCVKQIDLLRRILEGVRVPNLPFVGTFVNFCKAFDSIARLVMFCILRHYGVPDNVKKSWFLYSGTKSAVLVEGEMSGDNRCPARTHPSSLPICHCFWLGTPQMWQWRTRLHPLKKPKVNWTCSAWRPRKSVYALPLQRPNLLLVIFHTRVLARRRRYRERRRF